MEFKQKCDFMPEDADFTTEAAAQSKKSRLGPLLFLAVLTVIVVAILLFLVSNLNSVDSAAITTAAVTVLGLYVLALAVTATAASRARINCLPAVMIKGETIAVKYQLGYYCIAVSEIRSVTYTDGELNVRTVDCGDEERGITVSCRAGADSTAAALVFSFPSAEITVLTAKADEAAASIAELLRRHTDPQPDGSGQFSAQ